MAVTLFKLGLSPADTVLEIGCGTGKVSVAMAKRVKAVYALDRRPEAVAAAKKIAREEGVSNIEFFCIDALEYINGERIFDRAFIGGTRNLEKILPVLAGKVKQTIVINAVMVSTLESAVATLKDLGIFMEAVQVQVSRSQDIAGSIMFRPIDPVYIIVARGAACS
jgi:cobalt-precorrin-6B (C15)-methyltransferase